MFTIKATNTTPLFTPCNLFLKPLLFLSLSGVMRVWNRQLHFLYLNKNSINYWREMFKGCFVICAHMYNEIRSTKVIILFFYFNIAIYWPGSKFRCVVRVGFGVRFVVRFKVRFVVRVGFGVRFVVRFQVRFVIRVGFSVRFVGRFKVKSVVKVGFGVRFVGRFVVRVGFGVRFVIRFKVRFVVRVGFGVRFVVRIKVRFVVWVGFGVRFT